MNKTYWDDLEAAGHVLERDEDGEIDFFAFEYEFHNGPRCKLCGDCWCEHCKNEKIRDCEKGE